MEIVANKVYSNMNSWKGGVILTLVHKSSIQLHFHRGDTILFHLWSDKEICFSKYRIYIYKIQKVKQVTDFTLCMPMKLYLDCYMSFYLFCCLQIIFTRSPLMNIRLCVHFRLYPNSFRKGFLNLQSTSKEYYFISTRSIDAKFHWDTTFISISLRTETIFIYFLVWIQYRNRKEA